MHNNKGVSLTKGYKHFVNIYAPNIGAHKYIKQILTDKEIIIQFKIAKKSNSLKEIDNFSKTYNLSRPIHGERENLNRPVTSKKIESVIKSLPTKSTTRWPHL